MEISEFPDKLTPLVMPIDTWFKARRLAYLFEAVVGGKKVIISSFNTNDTVQPEVNGFINSLMQYACSEAFNPECELSINNLNSIY